MFVCVCVYVCVKLGKTHASFFSSCIYGLLLKRTRSKLSPMIACIVLWGTDLLKHAGPSSTFPSAHRALPVETQLQPVLPWSLHLIILITFAPNRKVKVFFLYLCIWLIISHLLASILSSLKAYSSMHPPYFVPPYLQYNQSIIWIPSSLWHFNIWNGFTCLSVLCLFLSLCPMLCHELCEHSDSVVFTLITPSLFVSVCMG